MKPKNRIIVALDVPTADAAHEIGAPLYAYIGKYKLGLELITAEGVPKLLLDTFRNIPVMLDLKLHDIPNTMAKAMKAACQYPAVWGVTVHVSAGRKALQQVASVGRDNGVKTIAVTVLTSHSPEEAGKIFNNRLGDTMTRFVRDAEESGCDAVVCSPVDLATVRANLDKPDDMTIICPGVRPDWAQKNDQARVTTPKQAVGLGADYLVIGRPITQPPEGMTPVEAAQRIAEELSC